MQYNLFEIVQELIIENEFLYISYAYWGFKAVHQLIISSRLSFPNYNEEKCSLCFKNRQRMEILNKIIIYSKANGLTINDYFSITQMPFNDIFSTYTLIHFNCESYVNTPLLVILNDYIITIYTKANTKKSKMLFKYIFSYRFTSNNNDFYVSYKYQFDNIVTLYFS